MTGLSPSGVMVPGEGYEVRGGGASIRLLPARQAPRRVSMVEGRSWIPMGDGVRLAASLYLPEAVEAGDAAPVVLEALPYRKDDVTASYRAEYERCAQSTGM